MKAVVDDGTRRVSVHEVGDAALLEPTDALVRIAPTMVRRPTRRGSTTRSTAGPTAS
ncbi:hypothetical protein ACGFMO_24595 [Streptomyces niveus]|uniref:hypothetical protein n=1 Tax=Streptomyces niveus TaxID=193462 RepID=UPI0037168872